MDKDSDMENEWAPLEDLEEVKWRREEKKENSYYFLVNLDLFYFTFFVHFNCYLNMFLKKEDYNFFK